MKKEHIIALGLAAASIFAAYVVSPLNDAPPRAPSQRVTTSEDILDNIFNSRFNGPVSGINRNDHMDFGASGRWTIDDLPNPARNISRQNSESQRPIYD